MWVVVVVGVGESVCTSHLETLTDIPEMMLTLYTSWPGQVDMRK